MDPHRSTANQASKRMETSTSPAFLAFLCPLAQPTFYAQRNFITPYPTVPAVQQSGDVSTLNLKGNHLK